MNRTLYISDLDGTLMTQNIELSNTTVTELNTMINSGLNFSIATARTAASTNYILAPLSLNLPIILMNGAAVYDMQSDKYLKVHHIPNKALAPILELLKANTCTGFLYQIHNNILTTFYQNLNTKAQIDFLEERVEKYNKKFIQIEDLAQIPGGDIVYISVMNQKDKLQRVYDSLSTIPEIKAEFYKDIYSDDNWYLEIFKETATKFNGIQFLKTHCNFDKVISFGDNLNDLSMFKASDEAYAVANAKEEVKKMATAIIDSNHKDGVVKHIKTLFTQSQPQ